MSEHNHTGLDEGASVINTMQAVRTGKAISAAAKGRCGRRALWSCRWGQHCPHESISGKIAAAALVLLALPLLFYFASAGACSEV